MTAAINYLHHLHGSVTHGARNVCIQVNTLQANMKNTQVDANTSHNKRKAQGVSSNYKGFV